MSITRLYIWWCWAFFIILFLLNKMVFIIYLNVAFSFSNIFLCFCIEKMKEIPYKTTIMNETYFVNFYNSYTLLLKGGSRHQNWCMARVLSFLIRYFSNYYTLHRSDLAAPLDPRLSLSIQAFKYTISISHFSQSILVV